MFLEKKKKEEKIQMALQQMKFHWQVHAIILYGEISFRTDLL